MAIDPHIHEYVLRVKVVQEGPQQWAICTHPECDHELDAQGMIRGLDASACIDQEQALELEKIVTGEANASGTEYLKGFNMAYRLRRYAYRLGVNNVVS